MLMDLLSKKVNEITQSNHPGNDKNILLMKLGIFLYLQTMLYQINIIDFRAMITNIQLKI